MQKVNVRLEFDDGRVQMTTYPAVTRVEKEDDGSLTAVVTSLPVILDNPSWKILEETQPESDADVLMWDSRHGRMFVDNYDHDSTPQWWIRRGITLWRELPPGPNRDIGMSE